MHPSHDFSPVDLEVLESIAADVARACGAIVAGERPAQRSVADTKSSSTDVVTVMDRRAETLAREILQVRRPTDSLLGEEGADVVGTSPLTWVVDPIDGTVNYLYGIPAYAVSVAAVVGDPRVTGAWQPVAGAVYNPETEEMFRGALGLGATLVDRRGSHRLAVNRPTDLAEALVGTGFGYGAEDRVRHGRLVAGLVGQVRDIRRGGSAALDLCSVAAGRLDAHAEPHLNPWDIAAGWVILTEAGGVLEGWAPDEPPSRDFAIAGARETVDRLREALAGIGRE